MGKFAIKDENGKVVANVSGDTPEEAFQNYSHYLDQQNRQYTDMAPGLEDAMREGGPQHQEILKGGDIETLKGLPIAGNFIPDTADTQRYEKENPGFTQVNRGIGKALGTAPFLAIPGAAGIGPGLTLAGSAADAGILTALEGADMATSKDAANMSQDEVLKRLGIAAASGPGGRLLGALLSPGAKSTTEMVPHEVTPPPPSVPLPDEVPSPMYQHFAKVPIAPRTSPSKMGLYSSSLDDDTSVYLGGTKDTSGMGANRGRLSPRPPIKPVEPTPTVAPKDPWEQLQAEVAQAEGKPLPTKDIPVTTEGPRGLSIPTMRALGALGGYGADMAGHALGVPGFGNPEALMSMLLGAQAGPTVISAASRAARPAINAYANNTLFQAPGAQQAIQALAVGAGNNNAPQQPE